jgi:hypothetical protein
MSVIMIQANFQFGEISPLMHARVDSPIYYRGVKRLRNMLVIPQGGAKRRFGTTYVDQINDHAGSPTYLTNYTQVKPFIFDYEDGARYLLIFRENAVDVYSNDVYQSTVVTTYTASQIASLSIAQSAKIVFIVHGDHPPRTLIRASVGPVVLTLTTPTFSEYPVFDFKQTYDTFNFSVKVGGVNITTAQNLLGQVVTVNSSAALFDANYVGGLFFGEGGVIRFTAFTSTTVMIGRIITVFNTDSSLFHAGSGNVIQGADCVVTEIAFSATRGYPQKVAFFQNRIFFGRTSSLLGGVWGSNYNGYTSDKLHFDDSEALDTNAISTIVQGTKATLIQHMVAFKTLLVFTTSGLYSTPLLIDLPLTPANISFLNLQTSDAANNVVPLVFDNDVIFFDKGGKKVKNVNVYATTQHYESKVISVLAPHLVDTPYSAAVFENSSVEDGGWLFMVNSAGDREGQLSIYQSVPEQEITAWSLAIAAPTHLGAAKFRHVVSDEETAYFIVERTVNAGTRLFIEKLNFSAFMDCSIIGTQALSTTISGLSQLNGETVTVLGKLDGSTRKSVVATTGVVSGGTVTLEAAVTDYEVGLFWSPQIVPLAVNVPMPNGNNLYMPKTIKNIFVDFYLSSGIRVNSDLIPPFRLNNVDVYNDPAEPQTDFVQVQTMTGWDPSAEIAITQAQPLPLTLLGICFIVST